MANLGRFFRARDKPTNTLPGSTYSFFFAVCTIF